MRKTEEGRVGSGEVALEGKACGVGDVEGKAGVDGSEQDEGADPQATKATGQAEEAADTPTTTLKSTTTPKKYAFREIYIDYFHASCQE